MSEHSRYMLKTQMMLLWATHKAFADPADNSQLPKPGFLALRTLPR